MAIGKETEKIEKEIKAEIKEVKKEASSMEKRIKKFFNNESNLFWIIVVLMAILVIILLFPNSVKVFKISSGEKIYGVEVIKLTGCEKCMQLTPALAIIQKANVKIKSEKEISYNSDEGRKLIAKYSIKKIPALIVIGKTNKIKLDENIFSVNNKAFVFDKAVPYLDLKTNELKGIVDLIEVYDSNCKECSSLSKIQAAFDNSQIKIGNYEKIEAGSEKGKKLIDENNIDKLPSLLVGKEVSEYWWVFNSIQQLLSEKASYYLFNELAFPYKEIKTGKIKGKVVSTYLVNNSCLDCYNVSMLKEAFANLGVYVASERSIDIASEEGKELVKSYNITAIPTAILSDEISDYEKLKEVLLQVGDFSGKKYVFRKLDVLNVKYQTI